MTALGLVLTALAAGCEGAKPVDTSYPKLRLLASHPLSIAEPSGLAIDETGSVLWTVTNDPEKVHQLDTNGTLVKTLKYDGHDLEGIAYDQSDRTLWVVEENRREVVHLDLEGNVLSKHPLGMTGELNSGLEGICVDDSGTVFVLNEKKPGMFVELGADVTVAGTLVLNFAGDYSGLEYDRAKACFWITSDQSQRLYRWTAATGVQSTYDLQFAKPEGVAFDETANLIYIVSDATNTLYVLEGPVD